MLKRCEGTRSNPCPPTVFLGGYQCQMFYRTGVHHQLTHLNKAPRSTRCCNINNMALPSWTSSCLLHCTLDPFGTRATNIGCQQKIKFLLKGEKDPETSMKTFVRNNMRDSNHSPMFLTTEVVKLQCRKYIC